jgi:hypothetical protein
MKTKLFFHQLLKFLIIVLNPVVFLSLPKDALSQIPQGFNYQAVAHNNAGAPIMNTTIQIKAGILSDTLTPVVVWEELHSAVKTNINGVFSLVIGTGNRQSGSALIFNDINWSKTPMFLRIQIYDQGTWKIMGSAKLWSVPYAMVAEDLAGSVKKLAVAGKSALFDEPLFEVKNKDGQTVFAVYSEGVRIYVDDGIKSVKGGFSVGGFGTDKAGSQQYFYISGDSIRAYIDADNTKSAKGGFSVGGFGNEKVLLDEYLRVTPDSTRIYIDDRPDKSKKGGFSVGGFDQVKTGRTQYFNVSTDTSTLIRPSQNRILWYPLKNAFLTGKVLIESTDSVGINSFTTGYESKAIGDFSQALGFKSVAEGAFSLAIGRNARASSLYSYAFGDDVRAIRKYSYSFGRNTTASGEGSFAFGSNTLASGLDSYAFGRGSQATGAGSFALGFIGLDSANVSTVNTRASGSYSVAIGMGAQATTQGAIAMGTNATASGVYSFAAGYRTRAQGPYSYAFGHSSVAEGLISFAFGNRVKAQGVMSTALGYSTIASGDYSTAFGSETRATSYCSVAMGLRTSAAEWFSTATGAYTKANGYGSFSTGNVTIADGMSSFSAGSSTRAASPNSVAMGFHTIAKPYAALVIGQYNDTVAISSANWSIIDPVFIVGNGTSDNSRSNAFTILKFGATAIGHSSPTQMLDVNGNARFRTVGSGAYGYDLNITSDGTLTTSTSDISMKKNIETIDNALDKVLNMNGVYFNWKDDNTNARKLGFIAQDMEKVLPEVVFTNQVDGLKGINYAEISAVLAEAIKEQQQLIESQNEKIARLEKLVEQILEKE